MSLARDLVEQGIAMVPELKQVELLQIGHLGVVFWEVGVGLCDIPWTQEIGGQKRRIFDDQVGAELKRGQCKKKEG